MLIDLLAGIESQGWVRAIRTSPTLYPALNGAHILGFALLIGAIGVFDIAVLRAGRTGAALRAAALPVARGGFALALATGLLLFACRATHYAANTAMLVKLGLLLLALANATAFHIVGGQRWLAGLSLGLWVAVLFAGRWIGFI